MANPLDLLVATTLAHTVKSFQTRARGVLVGLEFEQALFRAVSDAYAWHYATPPDQFDLGLPIITRTGVHYEHDGMFASTESLYVLEAKWHSARIKREHVGVLVLKLLDTLFGSYAEIGHLAIKPVIIAGSGGADKAAIQYAAAYGILLITPTRPTPFELLALLDDTNLSAPTIEYLRRDCETLANMLWRSFDKILRPEGGGPPWSFIFAANHIQDANRTAELLQNWDECIRRAEALHLLLPTSVPDPDL